MDRSPSQSQEETTALFRRLSRLPAETARQILLNLKEQQLSAICKDTETIKNRELKFLSDFCHDANFWRDWLLNQGYDLPETLPKLIEILRGNEEETDADLLRSIFFGDPISHYNLKKDLLDLLRHYYRDDEPYEGISMADLHQAVLDWDYIDQQLTDRNWRENVKKPRIFKITLLVLTPAWIPADYPQRLSIQELLEELVDRNFSGDNIQINTSSSIINLLTEKPLPARVWRDFKTEITEQDLALLPSFIREGDLILLDYKTVGGTSLSKRVDYYVGPKSLIKMDNEPTHFYFPSEAYEFLIDHNITDYKSLFKVYLDLDQYNTIGYTQGSVKEQFPGRRYRGY